jgi:hypothetical protein
LVLVGDRRAEQSEDAITGGLHDVAVVATHCVDHKPERRIDDRAGILGIEVLLKFGGALDVGEQRRDRLALATPPPRTPLAFLAGRLPFSGRPRRRLGFAWIPSKAFPCDFVLERGSRADEAVFLRTRNSRD